MPNLERKLEILNITTMNFGVRNASKNVHDMNSIFLSVRGMQEPRRIG